MAAALIGIAPDVVDCSTWEAETLHYLRMSDRAPVLVRGDLSAATMGAASLVPAERELVRRADAVAVSNYAARDLASVYGIRWPEVVPNGVDIHRFSAGPVTMPTTGYRISLNATGHIMRRTPLRDLLAARSPVPPGQHPTTALACCGSARSPR